MSSLRQILARHRRVLLLDSCSARVQLGWIERDGLSRWASSTEEAGIGLFKCLDQLGTPPTEADAFVFCDGPGSLLGVRIAAMAIRTWTTMVGRPVFAYHSLELIARSEQHRGTTVIADARRESWHQISATTQLQRVPTSALSGSIVTPEGFRNWTPLPEGVRTVTYDVGTLISELIDQDLFRETTNPDAFLHEEPSYVTWTPRIHRAP